MAIEVITPDWSAPRAVRALVTTRRGGSSRQPFDSANLAAHVGDELAVVECNRAALVAQQGLPSQPMWLNQTHGAELLDAGCAGQVSTADGSFTTAPGVVCAVMTADCLPVLMCNSKGTKVAAVHAGWRGLAAGILRNAVRQFSGDEGELLAYIGPSIGAAAFEVGGEVRQVFIDGALDDAHRQQVEDCFVRTGQEGKYLANLAGLARAELQRLGSARVFGGDLCSFSRSDLFYSYRREGRTGRNASFIWLE